jgi:hypothetical protein
MKKLPLLKIYLGFIVLGMLFASALDSYTIFSPKAFTLLGLFGVLASRFGLAQTAQANLSSHMTMQAVKIGVVDSK